jgi:site-specific DNA recombinase
VRLIFRWVGIDRVSLREVCRRLQKMEFATKTGKPRWDATTICGMLRNPVYRGAAMFGRTRSLPAKPRLRPVGRRPQSPRRASGSALYDPPGGVDRDSSPCADRRGALRSGSSTARGKSQTQAGRPAQTWLVTPGPRGLPPLWLCVLRQDGAGAEGRSTTR